MAVTMVEIRIVPVPVDQAGMPMDMNMRLWRYPWSVAVLVMLIVHMDVLVFHRLMGVFVLMSLGQVQPETYGHQRTAGQECDRHWIVQQQDRRAGAHERGQ